jgi:hypothetical protein
VGEWPPALRPLTRRSPPLTLRLDTALSSTVTGLSHCYPSTPLRLGHALQRRAAKRLGSEVRRRVDLGRGGPQFSERREGHAAGRGR